MVSSPQGYQMDVQKQGRMDTFEKHFLYQLAFASAEAKQTFVQHIGMSQQRYQLLIYLAEIGETSHATLQQQLSLDGATITRLVKQFEAEGLVSRRLDPQDNRYTLASLTDAGRQLVVGINEAHTAFELRLLDGISTEEQEAALRIMKRLRANIHRVQEEDQGAG
jgi:DNA-binding MarR family transcriptional regulator